MRKLMLLAVALMAVFGVVAGRANAASVLRVPQDYLTIQAAIDAASPGDTVSVSPGVYVEQIDNHSKAITIESTDGAAVTVIDGQGGALRLTAISGETPVLRGFTVEGGIFTSDGPALIESNRVLDDESCSGGIFAYFSGATIQSNLLTGRPNCSLFRPAIDIGGAGTVTVTRNVITANAGAGVSMNAAGSPTISHNTITANGGGGIGGVNQSDALIVNNVVAQNGYNGIDWSVPFGTRGPIIVNNTIAANSLSAIFVDGFARSMHVFNNILVGTGNQTVVNCPGSFFEKDPPILEFNDVISAGTGSRYGGVCADLTGLNGNISADPLFSGVSDFRLQLGSPAIDAGTSVGAPPQDLESNPRPRDGNADGVASWDMGAYEYRTPDTTPPQLSVSVTPDRLGPPNHKYVTVDVIVTATDDTDPSPTVGLVSVTSNEPDDAPGGNDGNTTNDVVKVDDYTFRFRAERNEKGAGRTYTVTYRATDASGNSATRSATVTVPVR